MVAIGPTITVLLCCCWCRSLAWNTTRLYGTPFRARLTDVAVWRNRAYVCWPRLDPSQPVTLLELPWPETDQTRWRPQRLFYADQQKLDDCRRVQSAVALDLDKTRGHLYVLDSGYENCWPKIVIYDLKTYQDIWSMELVGLKGSELGSLVVDARPIQSQTKVYAGDERGGYITVLDPFLDLWYRVPLYCDCDPPPEQTGEVVVPSEFIAISRLQWTVYFTSKRSHDLYSASLRDLRNLSSYVTPSVKNGDELPVGLRVRWDGVKLGDSSGLFVDVQGGLNYVYTRDFVAVRLGPGGFGTRAVPATPVAAEDHTVLLQSYDLLPAVTKIFTDNSNLHQIWAMNAVPNAENRHLVKINTL